MAPIIYIVKAPLDHLQAMIAEKKKGNWQLLKHHKP